MNCDNEQCPQALDWQRVGDSTYTYRAKCDVCAREWVRAEKKGEKR